MRTRSKPLVLLVDDDITYLRLMEIMLINSGCVIVTAEDARQALEELAQATPDLIIMDVFMPGLTGPELVERVHSIDRLKNTPVIFVTVNPTCEIKSLTRQPGIAAVLEKPLDGPTLKALVKSTTSHRQRQPTLAI